MSDIKHPDVTVALVGGDGNGFVNIRKVAKALRRAGFGDEVEQFMTEAMAGNYNELLATTMRWVDVQ